MDKIASRDRRTQKRTEGTYKARLLNSRRKKHRKRGEFFNQELFVLFFEPCFSQGRAGDWSKVLTIFGIKGKDFMTLKMIDEI